LWSSCDTLTSRPARRGFGQPPLALAVPGAERVQATGPDSGWPPASEVALDRVPRAESPWASCALGTPSY
jgi:hypothetical protein